LLDARLQLIGKIAQKGQVGVIIPPLASKRRQFTENEIERGQLIAKARIHIERAIQRAKMFRILSHEIQNTNLPHISMVVRVVFLMTNLMGDIVVTDD
jgi:hypothetical protein